MSGYHSQGVQLQPLQSAGEGDTALLLLPVPSGKYELVPHIVSPCIIARDTYRRIGHASTCVFKYMHHIHIYH